MTLVSALIGIASGLLDAKGKRDAESEIEKAKANQETLLTKLNMLTVGSVVVIGTLFLGIILLSGGKDE